MFTVFPFIETDCVLLNFVLPFLALIFLWLDFEVLIDYNVFGRLMVHIENNFSSITNMISSSSSVIPL
jgi:hypothetical protein